MEFFMAKNKFMKCMQTSLGNIHVRTNHMLRNRSSTWNNWQSDSIP